MNSTRRIIFIFILLVIIGVFLINFAEDVSIHDFKSDTYMLPGDMWKWSETKKEPGKIIMSAMGNATLKSELGRATWKFLHTMAGKYPNKPSPEEKKIMLNFIYGFAQVYPCGDCARHFSKLLKKNPPNVTDKEGLSKWFCNAHNIVNKRLEKPIFDCDKVLDMYGCGCEPEIPVDNN
ncbi:hypothetical protein HK098_000019 [Nowakowskiella sp. JEL0407]|nr:hypothetical protein HK098_000019 [Nowakowskiella sp. JEL0407]